MKKILLACIITLGLQQSYAQIGDKLVPHMGFMYQTVVLQDTFASASEFNIFYYTFHLGTYYTIAHANDIASVGVDGSVNFGFNFVNTFSGTRINLFTQVPIWLMGRVGANSTSYNQQKIGLGAGIGGHYTFYSDKLRQEKASFINPAAMAEVTILSRSGTLTVRGHMALSRAESALKSTVSGNEINRLRFGTWGIGLIYGF